MFSFYASEVYAQALTNWIIQPKLVVFMTLGLIRRR
jgi:hypothetical protein